jgi:hypothetical protein
MSARYEPGDRVEILVGGPHEHFGLHATVSRIARDGDLVIYFGDQDEDEWIYGPEEVAKLT